MKIARLLLFALAGLLVIGAIGIGLVLTPGIQRWAVLRATRDVPGLRLELASVAAGFSHVALQGVELEQDGLKIRLDHLEADYALLPLLFSHRLTIERMTARGLLVDASSLPAARTGATAAGGPALAPGLLAQVVLPFELVLTVLEVEGRALLPGAAGQPPIEGEYRVTGGKFAPGQEGSLLLVATLKNPLAGAPVTMLHVQTTLRATQTQEKNFSRVSLNAVVDAEGRIISEPSQLKVSAELANDPEGERYTVGIDTLLHGVSENLLSVQARLPAVSSAYVGDWTLNARTAQLEPFFLGDRLPDFKLSGAGDFGFDPTMIGGRLRGRLQAEASRLEAIDPALRAIGPVRLVAQFDAAEHEGIIRLQGLDIRLAGTQPVLELTALRAVELDLGKRRWQPVDTDAGEVLHLKLAGLPLAWIRPFVDAVDISGGIITGEFVVTGGPDRLQLSTVQALHMDELNVVQQGRMLLSRATLAVEAEATLVEQELRVKVGTFTLKTPAGDSINAQATVSLPLIVDPAITIGTRFTADLPTLLEPWLPLGRIKSTGEANLTLVGNEIAVQQLQSGVTDAMGATLFKLEALRPFTFDLTARRAFPEGKGDADLLRFTLGRLSLSPWVQAQPGAIIGGALAQGEFILATEGNKLTMRTTIPLQLDGLSLTQDGQPALTNLRIEAQPVVELTDSAELKIKTGAVTLRTAAGAPLATAQGEVTQSAGSGIRGLITFNVDVPALGSQPLFSGTQAVKAGRASGEIRLAWDADKQVEARMTLNGLVAAGTGQTLPVANLSFRAVIQEDGRISIQAPLLLDQGGRRSDLSFGLGLVPVGRTYNLEGKITGEQVELEDAMTVLSVFMAATVPPTAVPAANKPVVKMIPDPVPAWSRFSGRLALDIKSITRGDMWSMTGLNGLVVIQSENVTLQKLDAVFGEKGRLAAQGEIKFTGGAQPYQLAGDFSLTEFDTGKFFLAFEPGKAPTIEGLLTVTGHLAGTGGTLNQTLERTHGQFQLTGRQGVFRGLQRATAKVSMTSKAVELGASVLGSLFGSDKVTKAAEKVAGTAYFVDQLAQGVSEFKYDQLSVRLVRDDSLNMILEDISLISPEIRLLGKGRLSYAPEQPLLAQPLTATLSLSARGKIEQLLAKLSLTSGARDDLGYAKTKEVVTLGGTLSRPDPSAFFARLASAKLSDLLLPEN